MNRTKPAMDADQIAESAARWLFRRGAGLSPAELAEFETWRTADPRHAAALAEIDQAWSVLDRPLRSGRSQRVLQQLHVRARSRRRRHLLAAGSACLLLAMFGALWKNRPAPVAAPVAQVAIVTPATRTLPDGSVVQLKPGAEITVDFKGVTRAVALLRGEAHFQVAHDAKPFVVTAGAVEFRAVGTAFSVELDDASVELLVTQGRVAVEKPAAPDRAPASAAARAPRRR